MCAPSIALMRRNVRAIEANGMCAVCCIFAVVSVWKIPRTHLCEHSFIYMCGIHHIDVQIHICTTRIYVKVCMRVCTHTAKHHIFAIHHHSNKHTEPNPITDQTQRPSRQTILLLCGRDRRSALCVISAATTARALSDAHLPFCVVCVCVCRNRKYAILLFPYNPHTHMQYIARFTNGTHTANTQTLRHYMLIAYITRSSPWSLCTKLSAHKRPPPPRDITTTTGSWAHHRFCMYKSRHNVLKTPYTYNTLSHSHKHFLKACMSCALHFPLNFQHTKKPIHTNKNPAARFQYYRPSNAANLPVPRLCVCVYICVPTLQLSTHLLYTKCVEYWHGVCVVALALAARFANTNRLFMRYKGACAYGIHIQQKYIHDMYCIYIQNSHTLLTRIRTLGLMY